MPNSKTGRGSGPFIIAGNSGSIRTETYGFTLVNDIKTLDSSINEVSAIWP
nr:hypothetical protein SYMBAF_60006 [Serratia symbiotica]